MAKKKSKKIEGEELESNENLEVGDSQEPPAEELKSMKELCPNCLKLECECPKEEPIVQSHTASADATFTASVPGKYRKFQKGN